MTIDEAITYLQDVQKKGVKSVILALWESKEFGLPDDENWENITYNVEEQMDWSDAHDDISDIIEDDEA